MFSIEEQKRLVKKIVTHPVFMICAALVALYIAIDRRVLLAFSPKPAEAVIDSVRPLHDAEGREFYKIEYSFEVAGIAYKGSSNYGRTRPDKGQKITINYLDGHPGTNSYGYSWIHLAKSCLAFLVAAVYLFGFFKSITNGSS